ncbi:hypothetical protein KsCSTR_47010 [Candidatus Kuenenia stuttgartiensis]|uniref:Uncharacterized protein n=1 Tax=Kuenenia stuttgartiensis TaxID=174633 RepID=Q1PW35_KUEST|nr:hypothetical protein KsCSTR_47010 [Candidatus Kuenenia stuttgartiensis]CAJ71434.1 unknown protein [Candidatus Kuenenia stuttgartiensis]
MIFNSILHTLLYIVISRLFTNLPTLIVGTGEFRYYLRHRVSELLFYVNPKKKSI